MPKIAKCIFITAEAKSQPSGKTKYDYFVPPHINLDPCTPINLHAVVVGGDGVYTVVRIVEVVDLPTSRHRASKALIALVDDSQHREAELKLERARELMANLTAMDQRRKRLARFEALAETSPEAKSMLDELKGMSDTVPLSLSKQDLVEGMEYDPITQTLV